MLNRLNQSRFLRITQVVCRAFCRCKASHSLSERTHPLRYYHSYSASLGMASAWTTRRIKPPIPNSSNSLDNERAKTPSTVWCSWSNALPIRGSSARTKALIPAGEYVRVMGINPLRGNLDREVN